MKAASPAFIALLRQGYTELARIWKITLTNGKVYTFTDGSSPIYFNGELYICDPGIDISAIRDSTENGYSDASIYISLDDIYISEEAVRYRELYQGIFTIRLVHCDRLDVGSMLVFAGTIGDANLNNISMAELSVKGGLGDAFGFTVGEIYSERCRNVFGDSRCKFPIETLSRNFSVSSAEADSSSFGTNIPNGQTFELGSILWLTGDNQGKTTAINAVLNGIVSVPYNMYRPVKVGDTGRIRPGCSNYRSMCMEKYDNLKNLRAEPDVPNIQPEPPKVSDTVPDQGTAPPEFKSVTAGA